MIQQTFCFRILTDVFCHIVALSQLTKCSEIELRRLLHEAVYMLAYQQDLYC